jgi:hypothetical protein
MGGAAVKRAHPELSLHMAVAGFLRRAMPAGIPCSHFPAGEVRDIRTAAKLKAMGTAAGWPDLIFLLPTGKFGAIELKAAKGTLSEPQRAFRQAAQDHGAYYAECRSVEEVEETVGRWLLPFGHTLKARLVAGRFEVAA